MNEFTNVSTPPLLTKTTMREKIPRMDCIKSVKRYQSKLKESLWKTKSGRNTMSLHNKRK